MSGIALYTTLRQKTQLGLDPRVEDLANVSLMRTNGQAEQLRVLQKAALANTRPLLAVGASAPKQPAQPAPDNTLLYVGGAAAIVLAWYLLRKKR